MPLTDKGFQRLTYDELLEQLVEQAKLLYGDDIDTSSQSVIGKFLRFICERESDNQELAELVYLSAYSHTAIGVALDWVCSLVGISRNPATYAQHSITITGIGNATIPAPLLVAAGNVVFHTLEDCVLNEQGVGTTIVECNDSGKIGNVPTGTIVTVVNPDANVESITNDEIVKIATEVETDYELRARYSQAHASTGSSTIDSVRSAILRVSGVEAVLVLENDTSVTNEIGIPPHSFRTYVLAPESAQYQIAKAIFEKKPLGIGTDGDVVLTTTDIGGGEHEIRFSWTEKVRIHVKCTVVKGDNYNSDTVKTIKDNIVTKLAGYSNGQNVTATSLYLVMSNDGISDITELAISTDGVTYNADRIEIGNHQVARAIADDIEVTVNG